MEQSKNKPRRTRKLPASIPGRERGNRDRLSSRQRPAGEGGPHQDAGGPEHRGLPAGEDRNP